MSRVRKIPQSQSFPQHICTMNTAAGQLVTCSSEPSVVTMVTEWPPCVVSSWAGMVMVVPSWVTMVIVPPIACKSASEMLTWSQNTEERWKREINNAVTSVVLGNGIEGFQPGIRKENVLLESRMVKEIYIINIWIGKYFLLIMWHLGTNKQCIRRIYIYMVMILLWVVIYFSV